MFIRPLLAILFLDLCFLTCAAGGDKPSPKEIQAIGEMLKKQQTKEVRARGDKAIPAVVELFKQGKHRTEILPILANSRVKLARTTIEDALRVEDDKDWIFWQSRALGLLKDPESKPVLLATIKRVNELLKSLGDRETPPDEPNGLGVMVGGSTDCAHFALIWALGRIEGKEFGTSWLDKDDKGDYKFSGPLNLHDVSACILWWREYKKALGKKDDPAKKARGKLNSEGDAVESGKAALAQQKNALDGYDEGDIDFIKGRAKRLRDTGREKPGEKRGHRDLRRNVLNRGVPWYVAFQIKKIKAPDRHEEELGYSKPRYSKGLPHGCYP